MVQKYRKMKKTTDEEQPAPLGAHPEPWRPHVSGVQRGELSHSRHSSLVPVTHSNSDVSYANPQTRCSSVTPLPGSSCQGSWHRFADAKRRRRRRSVLPQAISTRYRTFVLALGGWPCICSCMASHRGRDGLNERA